MGIQDWYRSNFKCKQKQKIVFPTKLLRVLRIFSQTNKKTEKRLPKKKNNEFYLENRLPKKKNLRNPLLDLAAARLVKKWAPS